MGQICTHSTHELLHLHRCCNTDSSISLGSNGMDGRHGEKLPNYQFVNITIRMVVWLEKVVLRVELHLFSSHSIIQDEGVHISELSHLKPQLN